MAALAPSPPLKWRAPPPKEDLVPARLGPVPPARAPPAQRGAGPLQLELAAARVRLVVQEVVQAIRHLAPAQATRHLAQALDLVIAQVPVLEARVRVAHRYVNSPIIYPSSLLQILIDNK